MNKSVVFFQSIHQRESVPNTSMDLQLLGPFSYERNCRFYFDHLNCPIFWTAGSLQTNNSSYICISDLEVWLEHLTPIFLHEHRFQHYQYKIPFNSDSTYSFSLVSIMYSNSLPPYTSHVYQNHWALICLIENQIVFVYNLHTFFGTL
jgi:hypothetical protein